MKEMVGGCCVCSDERGWPENPLVYCDGASCNVAVHQACYGIVTVPTGPWYCRKCESQERSARVRCELCPSRTGALKKTNTSGWAHVVCALYIPEVRFGNVTTMEPINLDSIPVERYGKTCYICQEMNKGSKATMGACMQCNKAGCRHQFHVTCAQQLGLLCEEAGNYLDNVKYCGYCQHHYSKLKKGGNVKLIPPYKPITYETGSSDGPSSPEKESETVTGGSGGAAAIGAQSLSSTAASTAASEGQASSTTSQLSNNQNSSSTHLNTPAMSKGSGAVSVVSASGGPQTTNAVNASISTPPAAPSNASSSSTSKNRKSSSTSKGSVAAPGSGGAASNSQATTTSQSVGASASSGIGSSGGSSNGSSKSSGSTNSSSTAGGSTRDYKDKYGKSTGKASNSKDRDSHKEKSTKSSSSSSNSSSSSKNKESSSSGSHHHQSHGDSQLKIDHSRPEKVSSGGGNKTVTSASILAPSVLQTASASGKDGHNKFPYTEAADMSGTGLPINSDAGGAFVNESKLSGAANSSSTAPVSTKKRKASDSSKLHAATDEKIPMKEVSVTLIPLRQDKIDERDTKKVKSERGSPLQSINEPNQQTTLASSNSSAPANLLATQTGATSISITKQPPSQPPTTTNVIIKPPIIKDIAGHLSSSSSSSIPSSVTGGNGTTSLVVSVPLSPVPGGATLNLPGTTTSTGSSASQNLFQQAIQNRSEHLNFPNSTRTSQPSPAALSRSSPIIATGLHLGGDHHGGGGVLHHRQSPLIQASNLSIDNGGRNSLSPSMGGGVNAVHQSDSGMLKVTYEKQAIHSTIVNPGNSNRLTAIQDDVMSSSRRSSVDCGIFQSAVGPKGLFNALSAKRPSRDYGVVTSSSNVVKHGGDKAKNNNQSPSNLFTNASVTAAMTTFKSSAPPAVVSTACTTDVPFSSFVTSSRTPDFNSFGGGGGSGAGGGLKISYEAQMPLSVTTTTNTTLLTPSPSPSMSQTSGQTTIASNTIGAQPIVKDSPPSSPSSEAGSSTRKRSRKQDSAGMSSVGGAHGKVFQNGIHASHMLGNQLNPNSSVAQKMSDQLHMELEAHSVYTSETSLNLVGPLFPGKQSSSASSTSSSSSAAATASNKGGGQGPSSQGPPSLSSMLSGGNTASGGAPQSLEQLLERQWEQGSQFLMEQAQHFDIASLLSCLHQLRAENVRLEDHVNNLVARRDHLLAVNARLAIPLTQSTGGAGSFNATSNGPVEGPTSNLIQRGGEASNNRSGGRNAGHGSYTMENGIDFRSAAQQQSMMMGHPAGQVPSNASGNSGGIVRNTTASAAGCGSGVVIVATSGSSNNGGSAAPHLMSGAGSGARMTVNSSNANNIGHPCTTAGVVGGGGGGGGAINSHSNGSLIPTSLMGVVGNSVVSGTNSGVVTALSMISGASRPIPTAPSGITYPTTFQHFRRDDAQMKPS